jgi:hypothetical protein
MAQPYQQQTIYVPPHQQTGAPSSSAPPQSFLSGPVSKNVTLLRMLLLGMILCFGSMMVLIAMAYNLPLQACDVHHPGNTTFICIW